MSPKDILVGKTYRNRGAGRNARTVLDIGPHLERPVWLTANETGKPGLDESVVKFSDKNGEISFLFLRSFSQWAGGVV